MNYGNFYFQEKDEWGNTITFCKGEDYNGSAYSDRLFQWDPKKHDTLCKKHFGDTSQYWDNRSPEKIEQFLQEYNGFPLTLQKIVTGTNVSTGYPFWCFMWKRLTTL